MKSKLLICHLCLSVIVLLFVIFFPIINIHIYKVYIYDLSLTEISNITFNFFEVAFNNNYLGSSIVFCLVILFILAIVIFDVLYYKKGHKWMFYLSFILAVCLFCFFSFSNTIYSKVNGISAYCYVSSFLDKYPNFPILFEESDLYKESVWVDLGWAQIVAIVFLGIKITVYFFSFFLNKNFLNSFIASASDKKEINK